MTAETEVGAENKKIPKAQQFISTEIVLGMQVQEAVPPQREKIIECDERVSEQLKSWSKTVEANSAIVLMAIYGHVILPPICTYIIAPELEEGDGFRRALFSYLQEALPGDRIEEKNIAEISLIAVSGKFLSAMDLHQRKKIFGGFLDFSWEK